MLIAPAVEGATPSVLGVSPLPEPVSRREVVGAALAVAAVAALALAVQLRGPLNSDVAFLLSAARRVLHGEVLYRDILEINPPLIVWIQLPVVFVADALGVRDSLVMPFAVLLLVLGSLAASYRLFARTALGQSRRARLVAVTTAAIALLLLPAAKYGQREHLLAALTLPFLVLTALRVERAAIGIRESAAVGFAAALGFAIKPHFALMWLLLIGYRILATRRWPLRVFPEDLVVIAVGLLYPLAVVTLTPGYFEFVGEVMPVYLQFGAQPVGAILRKIPAMFIYAVLAAWWTLRRGHPRQSSAEVLAIAAFGALLAVLAQGKGWGYHFYPVTAAGFLLAACALLAYPSHRIRGRSRASARHLAMSVIAVFGILEFDRVVTASASRLRGLPHGREASIPTLTAEIRGYADARSLLVLSSEVVDAFPVTNDAGLEYRGSFPYMWIFTWVYTHPPSNERASRPRAPADMPGVERYAFARVVGDFTRRPPDLLLAETAARNRERVGPPGIDYLAYFAQDPGFAAQLREYRQVSEVEGVRILRRSVR